jgi:hypothetical protein
MKNNLVILLLLLVAWQGEGERRAEAALDVPPKGATTARLPSPITVEPTRDSGGSTIITIRASKIKETGVLIRVLPPWMVGKCDPNNAVLPGLDLRDSYSSDRDISPSISGAWGMSDGSDGTRKYTGMMSPSRLRQQFITYQSIQGDSKPTSIGAVTGGSVGAIVYACLYRVSGGSIAILGEASSKFVSESTLGERHVDMSAALVSKALVVGDGPTRFAKIVVQTRSSTTCVTGDELGVDPALVPSVEHISSIAHGISLEVKEFKPQARAVKSMCDAIDAVGDGTCKICVRTFEITSPVEVAYPEQTVVALDMVSRFEIPTADAGKGAQLVVRFVIPSTSMCISQDGKVCVNDAPQMRAMAEGDGGIRISVKSGGKETSANQVARDGTATYTATMYDGQETCITTGPNTKIYSAMLGECTGSDSCNGGMPSQLSLVSGGSVNSNLARFSSGVLKAATPGAGESLCFVPTIGIGTRKLTIVVVLIGGSDVVTPPAEARSATPAVKTAVTIATDDKPKKNGWGMPDAKTPKVDAKERPQHGGNDDDDHQHHGGDDQQHHGGDDHQHHGGDDDGGRKHALNVIVSFACQQGEHFDHGRNRCEHDDHGSDNWWIEFLIFVCVIIVIIGVILCIAFAFEDTIGEEEIVTEDHHHTHQHHRVDSQSPFVVEDTHYHHM